MGVWRYLLHDFFTAREFNQVDDRLTLMRSTVSGSRNRILELERDLGTLTLLTKALLEACRRKGIATDEELHAILREIDESDGRIDGRSTPRPGSRPLARRSQCPFCGKSTRGSALRRCRHCGKEIPRT